jgi:hypothetical protein
MDLNEGVKTMTTNQKLYAWHEARMTAGIVISAAGVAVSLYAMSPWVREKCYNARVKISDKIHKHKRDKSR